MKIFMSIVALVAAAALTSCSCVYPVAATSNNVGTKCGEASATTILGILTFNGDCSIDRAAKKAGIKQISHVDQKVTDILGIFGTTTTYVYGE